MAALLHGSCGTGWGAVPPASSDQSERLSRQVPATPILGSSLLSALVGTDEPRCWVCFLVVGGSQEDGVLSAAQRRQRLGPGLGRGYRRLLDRLVCYPALYNDLILKGLSTLQDPSPSPAPLPPQNNMQEREKTTTTNNKKPTPESFSSIFQTLTASPPPQFPVCLSQKRFLTAGYPHIRVYDSCGSCPVCGGCPEWACAVWSPVYVWRELCAQKRRVKDAQKSDGPVVVNPFWSFSL